MYVQEIVLEGFKTYMNRTVITAFDPQFNAITGLNGSGKSNILDAIQFLLGSTSKQMLRLKSGLSELIYKQGFAGIQKASVTIRFRCMDKNLRPSGYQNCQELVITRQITKDKITKFFVNGLASNLSKVKSLFRSVHLNIQNPHFLVKQGQITKVINLKPLQLLVMIQQTAGTAYYNRTKTQSQKIMAKKDLKLKSVNQILSQSIVPQMEKLNGDRRRYNLFKDKQGYLKRLTEQIRIYQYVQKTNQSRKLQSQILHLKEMLNNKRTYCKESGQKINELQGQIKIFKSKAMSSIHAEYNKIKNAITQKMSQNNQIKLRIENLNSQAINIKKDMNQKQQLLDRKKKQTEWQNKLFLQTDKKKQQFQGLIHQISLSNNENGGAILEKQLKQVNALLKSIQAQINTMQSKRQILKMESQNEHKQREQLQSNNQNLSKMLKEIERQIQQLEKMQPPKIVEDPQVSSTEMKRLENQKKRYLQNYQLKLLFNDPHPGFDRTKVKGKLFMLFKVKDRLHQKALEIGAGAKLINIVVDNQITSKMMIQRDCFGKNVTVIPNNKIRFKQLKAQTIIEAHRIAKQLGGLAQPAYDLVKYDQQVQNSIKFAFSEFIVCSSPQVAKRIAFNSNKLLACKCVTYEGDVFQAGTLTGGYNNIQSMLLNQYNDLKIIDDKLKEQTKKFEGQKKKYEDYLNQHNQYKNKKKELQIKYQKRDKIKQKILNLAMNIKERDYARQIQDIESKINMLKKQHTQQSNKINSLQKKDGKNIEQQKQQILKQKKLCQIKLGQIKKSTSLLQVQIQQLNNHIKNITQSQIQMQKQIYTLQRKHKKLQTQLIDINLEFQKKQQEKKKYQKDQALNQSHVSVLSIQLNQVRNMHDKAQHQLNNIQIAIDSTGKQIINTKETLKKITQQCPWISPDKEYQIDTQFNYQTALADFKSLGLEVDKLKKTAKMNIDQNSYQKLQEQYKDLLEKRQILQKDKLTLLTNIHDLDQKRTVTLEHCFAIVKQNLSRIFTDLLPGAQAVLNLVDKDDVTQGAQLHIYFNKVKKELSELSGGQRSLLALSFILSLLLYKPSPFYILDQIDSALDLSHTENIGYMISQRFPQSQFIIISLKQGMFQNANVLYKVSFVDGQSKVERQTLKKK